jgi:predicted  nucleic acid-binding Zn-ribbon protein
MKSAVIFAILLGSAGALANNGEQVSVDAVQKVVQMLQDMSAKAKQEKNAEQVSFAEFSTWCTHEKANLKTSIAKGAESMEVLDSEINKLTVEAKVLGEDIGKLQADVADYEANVKSSTAQRAKDNKAFLAESQDYAESVDAIDRAIVVLQKRAHDQPAALLQLSESAQLPAKAQAMIQAFMGMMDDASATSGSSAPEANAYEFQSSGVVDMLKKLKDEFRGQLADCQKEEMNSKHAFDMKIADLTDSIENSNSDIEQKSIQKSRKQEKAASDKKELASTTAGKAEDTTTLKDATTECAEKSMSFDEKQQLRTEEIAAIQQAIKILTSEAASGGEKHLSMAQKKAASLVQLRGGEENAEESEGIRRKVREFLESEGARLHSSQLSLLAQKLVADPFGKVKKMIDSMITRLLNEANDDAQHEGFCDQEVGKSKVTRAKLSEDIDALTAAVEEGKSTIMSLTEEIATLSKEVAELDASRTEATKMRTAEKAKNKATVADTSAAQKAVEAAVAVLKKFYEGASVATGFVQTDDARPVMGSDEWNQLANPNFKGTVDKGHKKGMQTFGESYQGNQDEAGGVLAMLEVVQSDYANIQADTKADESSAQKAYDDFMTESQKNKAMKDRKISMSNSDKASAETKVQDDTKDLKGTQDELLAADRYYAKLVPQCFDKGQTFEERTASREEEISSLKQALKLLGGQ